MARACTTRWKSRPAPAGGCAPRGRRFCSRWSMDDLVRRRCACRRAHLVAHRRRRPQMETPVSQRSRKVCPIGGKPGRSSSGAGATEVTVSSEAQGGGSCTRAPGGFRDAQRSPPQSGAGRPAGGRAAADCRPDARQDRSGAGGGRRRRPANQPLIVVEAMKMENELRAFHAGTIVGIHVKEGASVEAGALLIDIL